MGREKSRNVLGLVRSKVWAYMEWRRERRRGGGGEEGEERKAGEEGEKGEEELVGGLSTYH